MIVATLQFIFIVIMESFKLAMGGFRYYFMFKSYNYMMSTKWATIMLICTIIIDACVKIIKKNKRSLH